MTRLRYILDLLSVMPEFRLIGTACPELDSVVDVSYVRCTKREFDVSGLSTALQVKWLYRDIQKAIFGALMSINKFPWTPDGFAFLASEIEHRLPSRPWFLDADVGGSVLRETSDGRAYRSPNPNAFFGEYHKDIQYLEFICWVRIIRIIR